MKIKRRHKKRCKYYRQYDEISYCDFLGRNIRCNKVCNMYVEKSKNF